MPNTVAIVLDARNTPTFTCLDIVHGHVQLTLQSEETITNIQVKMEGVSRTVLTVPKSTDQRSKHTKQVIETHKLLYQAETVFPPEDVRKIETSGKENGFTLAPGRYVYPFQFRLPINSKCQPTSSFISKLSFKDGAGYHRDPTHHLVVTLPPSLSDMSNNAVIKYYFKVTVRKAKFYRMNMREYNPFVFLPFEPPRPKETGEMFYVRRKHQFPYTPAQDANAVSQKKKKGFLSSFSRSAGPALRRPGPEFYIEARMPDPPIVVPTQPLRLFLFARTAAPLNSPLYLHALRINLVARTLIAAQEHTLEGSYGLTVFNLENMKLAMGTINKVGDMFEAEFDSRKWANAALPNTVPPSFKTCNIARKYSLEIFATVSHGPHGDADNVALAFDISVYSGVHAPQQLLQATTEAYKLAHTPNPYNVGPAADAAAAAAATAAPAQQEELPTYDEAIASSVSPVEGPRPTFQQSPAYYTNIADMDRDQKN